MGVALANYDGAPPTMQLIASSTDESRITVQ